MYGVLTQIKTHFVSQVLNYAIKGRPRNQYNTAYLGVMQNTGLETGSINLFFFRCRCVLAVEIEKWLIRRGYIYNN